MNYKHGDRVVVYKFFQGIFSEEFGEKRINPYGKEGKFLGIIDIVGGGKRRSVQCSTKPGVIRNNFIWYPVDEENSRLKALKIFKARENILFHKAEMEIETRIEHERYLDSLINDLIPTYPCDPEKNINCKKTECFMNGGECYRTINKSYQMLTKEAAERM